FNRRALEVISAELAGQQVTFAHSVSDKPLEGETLRFTDSIKLHNISFSYNCDQTRKTIEDFSVEIRKGQTVGIVGPSGSGKTTLVDILLGLLFPEEGTVLVDDRPLTRANMARWHALIGYIPQDIFLYDETLLKNVAFCVDDNAIDRTAIERALRTAQLEDFVQTLPAGLDTVV